MSVERQPTARTILFVLFGPIVWAVHFLIVYGAHAALCEAGNRLPLDASALPAVQFGSSVVALLFIVAAGVWHSFPRALFGAPPPLPSQMFLVFVMRVLCALSALAILWSTLTLVMIPACR